MSHSTFPISLRTAFTIVELLVTTAIVAVIAAAGFPAYRAFQNENDGNAGFYAVLDAVRFAQESSRAVSGDSGWGVALRPNHQAVLFEGSSYALRNSASDQAFTLPSDTTTSGMTEIDFSKFFGFPVATGTITVSIPGGASRTMTINAKGTVSF